LGADFHTRGRRTDEAIRLLRHLLSGASMPFVGRFYDYQDGVFHPLPVQGERLPILIDGNSPAALRCSGTSGSRW